MAQPTPPENNEIKATLEYAEIEAVEVAKSSKKKKKKKNVEKRLSMPLEENKKMEIEVEKADETAPESKPEEAKEVATPMTEVKAMIDTREKEVDSEALLKGLVKI